LSWNYRVIKRLNHTGIGRTSGEPKEFITFGIYETYYEADEKTVRFVSAEPIEPWGDTYEELKDNMRMMTKAFRKPVIEWNHAWDDE